MSSPFQSCFNTTTHRCVCMCACVCCIQTRATSSTYVHAPTPPIDPTHQPHPLTTPTDPTPTAIHVMQISDSALRCFINLADRFIRKGQDPAPLTDQGLTQELIDRLMKLNTSSQTPQAVLPGGTPDRPSTSSTSNVINLLSSLCRGSAGFTHVSV